MNVSGLKLGAAAGLSLLAAALLSFGLPILRERLLKGPQDSPVWLVVAGCEVYYDGCNQCDVWEGACTQRGCRPRTASAAQPPQPEKPAYSCTKWLGESWEASKRRRSAASGPPVQEIGEQP